MLILIRFLAGFVFLSTMKKQDHLFSLIHAMTASEKRYFKLFCSIQKGEKFYLRLFDYIDRTEKPSNAGIQEKFKAEPQARYLPRIKHYLFQLILRSLRSFHDEKAIENQLYNKLHEVRILYDKGLWDICLDMVDRAIELSTTHHLHALRLEFYKWRSRIADVTYDIELIRSVIKNDYPVALQLVKETDEYFRYLSIYDEFYAYYKSRGIQTDEASVKMLSNLVSDPLMTDEAEPSYFYSRILYHSIRSTYAVLAPGRLAESVHHSMQLLRLLEANPEIIRENPKTYFAVMNNLLTRLAMMGDTKPFYERLKEYRRFPEMLVADKRNYYETRVYINSLQLEMEFSYRYGFFEEAFALWKAHEKKVLSMDEGLTSEIRMVLLLSAAKIYWMYGKCSSSNKILNRIIQSTDNEKLREDIWFLVYVLKLLNYFRLDDRDGVEVTYRVFHKRYIENFDPSSAVIGERIINFFRKNHRQFIALEMELAVLQAELEACVREAVSVQELNAIKYFEPFYMWLYASVHRQDMLQAFQGFSRWIGEIEAGIVK